MSEFSLFGEADEPQVAKKQPAARPARKEKKPTAKQLRMQAPPPKIVTRPDDTLDAVRVFGRFGMLASEERRKFSDALRPTIDPVVKSQLEKWRDRWSPKS